MTNSPRYSVLGLVVSPLEVAGLLALAFVCAIAFWRGGPSERRVAGVILLAWLGSLILDDDNTTGIQWAIFAIDVLLAIWLAAEVLFGPRIWLYFALAAQVMIVMTHIAFMIQSEIVQDAFYSAYYFWSYVVLGSLAIDSLFKPVGLRTKRSV